ncbi:hypothetical protein [Actinokineospora globicatena]|uniref:hypothetical protein n=1 Tax=Actinokineospora globicatena TaxID=103729 RepID=UPI0025574C5D|nr:hypothetical protein [Actinokineospora globicatena]
MTEWLDSFTAALDEVLDVEAGLADIRLRDTVTPALDRVLDVDAGLAAILSTKIESDGGPMTALEYAVQFGERPAADRLAARAWFPLRELAIVMTVRRVLVQRNTTTPDLKIGSSVPAGSSGATIDLAVELCDHLGRAFMTAKRRDHELRWGTRTDSIALRQELERELHQAQLAYRDTSDSSRLGAELGRARRVLDRVVEVARGLPHSPEAIPTGVVGDMLESALTVTLLLAAEAAATSMADPAGRAFTAAMSVAALAVEAEALAIIERALVDATAADLTDADLRGVRLDGVLWSSRTRWPAHLTDYVAANSERIGPDLFRVRSGGVATRLPVL